MVPTAFLGFFAASAGASAALIGLLFVAISISPERIISQQAAPERRVAAVNIFAALLNGFFISLAALIPRTNLAYVVILLAPLSAFSSLRQIVGLLQRSWQAHEQVSAQVTARRLLLALASFAIYACEIWWAIGVFTGLFNGISGYIFIAYLLICVYTTGLTRAWGLIVERQSSLIPWLGSLGGREGAPAQTGDAQPAEATANATTSAQAAQP